jgi:hypothetical protein
MAGRKGAAGGKPTGVERTVPVGQAETTPPTAFLAGTYVFAVLLGAALGLYGAFLAPAGPRLGGLLLSAGVAVAVVGNGGASLLLAWLTGTRLGIGLLILGWAVVVLWLGTGRPEGDIILPSGATSYVFLLAGVIVPVGVAFAVRPRRGLFAPLPPPPPPGRRA